MKLALVSPELTNNIIKKKKITDKVFLFAYKQAMLNHPFLNLEVKIYL